MFLYVNIGCAIFRSKNFCTHTITVNKVFNYYPYVGYFKDTQKWKNIGIGIAFILYIGELLTGYATRKYWVWILFL